MKVFEQMQGYGKESLVFGENQKTGHEQLVFGFDEKTGMKTIIAIHDTTLGPAAGGTRFWNYESEDAALYDVLRLSRGMTLKNAAAGLKLGGGKAVLIGDPKKLKSQDYFHAYGRIVDSLGGKYYTAEDVNINTQDIDYVNQVTRYVTGTHAISGNPSPFTARGVYKGMKAGATVRFGTDSLKGMTVVVQGLGSVGYSLCEMLHQEGAKLRVYDINEAAIQKAQKELGAEALTADAFLAAECDVLAPCALGALLSVDNVQTLRCKMICGAANNLLVDAHTGDELAARDILYLPDYIVNAGGIINCAEEICADTYNAEAVNAKVDEIYDTTLKVLALAKEKNVSTYDAAELYAWEIIREGRMAKA